MITGRTDEELSVFGFPPTNFNEEIPQIGAYDEVFAYLRDHPAVDSMSPQLSGFAVIHVDEEQNEDFPALLFGVDGESYAATFSSAIEIVSGTYPAPGEPFLLVQENGVEQYLERAGVALTTGDPVLLTSFGGGGIRIRELPVQAVFRFTQATPGLQQVALVDGQTFRSLQGLVVSAGQVELSVAETEILATTDLDGMFGDAGFGEVEATTTAAAEITEGSLLSLFSERERVEPVIDSGAWHFLLVRLQQPAAAEAFIEELNAYFVEQDISAEANDWQQAAGGFSRLAAVIQNVFNGAIVVIAVVAIIIIMNTLVISVIERTSEIGTMRALGARRGFVLRMFVTETLSISWISGVAGILIGAGIVGLLNLIGLRTESDFLIILFGGEVLRPTLSLGTVLVSTVIVTGIGVFASIYPVLLALRIQPVRAVQAE
jgi:putative ABC transport system permease protein